MLGDSGVGKSCVHNRMTTGGFEAPISNIGNNILFITLCNRE